MPSKSKKQHNLMAAVANNPAFAKKVGISKSVGEEFMKADKGRKFKGGGMAKSDMKEDTKMDKTQDKAMIKKAFAQHDAQEHKGGKGTKLALKKGGMAKGCGYSKGGQLAKANGVAVRGKTKGKNLGDSGPSIGIQSGDMKKGGNVKKCAKGGGIEVRGKTKSKMC
jgi:hypothetical protein